MRATCPNYLIFLDLTVLIISGEIMKLICMQLLITRTVLYTDPCNRQTKVSNPHSAMAVGTERSPAAGVGDAQWARAATFN